MCVNNSKTLLAIYSWSVLSSWLLGIIFLFLSRIIYFLLQCYHAWFYEDEIWLRRVQKIRLRLKAQDPVKLKAHCYKSGREPKSLEARLHVVPEVIPGATCFVLGTIICARIFWHSGKEWAFFLFFFIFFNVMFLDVVKGHD
jgi:hypothetical protein